MAQITVVFDFDRTIIDGDSDNWVVTQMGLTPLFKQLYSTMHWNSLMDRMMEELHAQGRTTEDVAECLKGAILDGRIIAAIKSAYAFGCDLRIISDANQYFIETILEHHGLLGCFSEIHTNPTFVDGEGRLRISPYHALDSPPHDCQLCPLNMCKGVVIDGIRASKGGKERLIYLGDGKGDFCPTLKLREGDYVMPRKNYRLWELSCENSSLIKAQVHQWSNGEELERILLQLIDSISSGETSCDSGQSNSSNSRS